jgi:hypothetical protein
MEKILLQLFTQDSTKYYLLRFINLNELDFSILNHSLEQFEVIEIDFELFDNIKKLLFFNLSIFNTFFEHLEAIEIDFELFEDIKKFLVFSQKYIQKLKVKNIESKSMIPVVSNKNTNLKLDKMESNDKNTQFKIENTTLKNENSQLMEEITRLKYKNKQLKKENKELKKENTSLKNLNPTNVPVSIFPDSQLPPNIHVAQSYQNQESQMSSKIPTIIQKLDQPKPDVDFVFLSEECKLVEKWKSIKIKCKHFQIENKQLAILKPETNTFYIHSTISSFGENCFS